MVQTLFFIKSWSSYSIKGVDSIEQNNGSNQSTRFWKTEILNSNRQTNKPNKQTIRPSGLFYNLSRCASKAAARGDGCPAVTHQWHGRLPTLRAPLGRVTGVTRPPAAPSSSPSWCELWIDAVRLLCPLVCRFALPVCRFALTVYRFALPVLAVNEAIKISNRLFNILPFRYGAFEISVCRLKFARK